jgi:hypothetical protein
MGGLEASRQTMGTSNDKYPMFDANINTYIFMRAA